MKIQKLILIVFLLVGINLPAQVDTSKFTFAYNNGKYTSVTNKSLYYNIASSYLSARLFSNIALDTSVWAFKMNNGKYVWVTNKTEFMGIDSGLIEIPLYLTVNPDTVMIGNTFDTSYIHLRIDSLANSALDIVNFGTGYFPLSDGSEFKPADIDSLIGAKYMPLSDSTRFQKFSTLDSIYDFGVSGTDTIFLTTNQTCIIIGDDNSLGGCIDLPNSAANGTEFTIVMSAEASIESVYVISGEGYIYTVALHTSYPLAPSFSYTFKKRGTIYFLINKSSLADG